MTQRALIVPEHLTICHVNARRDNVLIFILWVGSVRRYNELLDAAPDAEAHFSMQMMYKQVITLLTHIL